MDYKQFATDNARTQAATNADYRKGFEDGVREYVGTVGKTLACAIADIKELHSFQPPIAERKTPMEVAISECEGMAVIIDVWAGRATEQDHKNGQYGNWCHDSEVLRFAAHLLKRYYPTKSDAKTTACGDCDPCLGGRPDQCAVMAKGKP